MKKDASKNFLGCYGDYFVYVIDFDDSSPPLFETYMVRGGVKITKSTTYKTITTRS